MPDDQKYRREIEEILERVNENLPAGGGKKARVARRPAVAKAPRAPRGGAGLSALFTPGRLVVGGVVLLLAALIIGSSIPFWIGLAAIVAAYFAFFTKPRRPVEKRWRGQSIEDPPADNAVTRLWRWINRN